MKRKELIGKVKQWHRTRGITIKGNSITQYAKLCEEANEYFEAIKANTLGRSNNAIYDAVGDMQVVIIAIAELCKIDLDYEINLNGGEDSNDYNTNFIRNSLLALASPLLRHNIEGIKKHLEKLLASFNSCSMYNSYKCLELAYNEIKNRYGLLISNGNFIKGSELKITEIDVRLFGTFVTLRAGNLKIQVEVGLPTTGKYATQSNYIPEGKKPKTWQEFMEQAPDNLIIGDYRVY